MKVDTGSLINVLHRCAHASLATHCRELPGYPYLSVLPFVPDECHRPVFLISALAEHARNLDTNPKASLLLFDPAEPDPQARSRLTIIGEIHPFEPSPWLIERYVRYQPTARRLLALADFRFVRIRPERHRFIGGFGRMGWLDGTALNAVPPVSLKQEAQLLATVRPQLRETFQALGVDRWGADLCVSGTRKRIAWPSPPVDDTALESLIPALLEGGCGAD